MAVPILATKLYIPPPPLKVVARPRLHDQLNEGLSIRRKLTLISAPAGFGKSTLVSAWLSHCGRPAVWFSLDENDNDPILFWTYFISALQKVAPQLGTELLDILQASPSATIEAILVALLNEITALPEVFILVLDDYHVIESRPIDEALTFFVEHLPPQMHLVITTREDPALPLPRFRVRGQLTELRAADLRFTPSEAAAFLNQVMRLGLSAEDVAALETRTEGWIAGLQLAALSMKGNQDVAGFIRAFAGDHRYIVDYLVAEVMQHQPEPMRNFLLQSSILERLNGPLCDTVTGQPGSKEKLETLQRGNFFLISLDDRRHWYRYHHLFADVLRMHLKAEQPDQLSTLHRRASEWYAQNGSVSDAIHHALAGADFERAAELIERAVPEIRRSRQEATLLDWLQALPDELLYYRPVLSVHYAGTLLQTGQLNGVEARLRDAERWLDSPEMHKHTEVPSAEIHPGKRMIVVDEEDFHRLPGSVAMYRAGIALVLGDVANTVKFAQRVLEVGQEDDYFLRGAASALLGLAFWTSGDLETAYRTYADGMAHLQRVGHISDVIGGSIALADIRFVQGRLREAMSSYERGLQLAIENGTPGLRGTADMYVGMSELHREYNDLNAALQLLLKSKELGEFAGFPQHPYRWRVAMARLQVSQGVLNGALNLLQKVEQLYVSDFFPNVRPVAALRARVWIAQGKLGEAVGWAREQGLSAADELNYLHEFEHITLARLLLAQYKHTRQDSLLREAIGLLERLLKAAQEGERMGSVIEILMLQALTHKMLGDIPSAAPPLQHALTLARPEGYVRLFLDEGEDMAQLLRDAAAHGMMSNYAGKLLAAFKNEPGRSENDLPPPTPHPLIEPLSQRELEILRLFKTELSGPEIADELVIALSTVRTHTKGIYSKLNVNSRRMAVKRAIELGLI